MQENPLKIHLKDVPTWQKNIFPMDVVKKGFSDSTCLLKANKPSMNPFKSFK